MYDGSFGRGTVDLLRCRFSMLRSLAKSLIAVLIGNVLYLFVVMPHVPPAGRHQPFRLDLGLVIDFWVCVACWGVIQLLTRRRR